MFYYIRGILEGIHDNFIGVDCSGVCYKIYTSRSTKNFFTTQVGKEVKAYTTMIVREDAQDIYGFSDEDELNIFKLLLTVSGVGPKGAISLLSYFSVDSFCDLVAKGDSRSIALAPGLGIKTAQKLIIELKDKLPKIVSDISLSEVSKAAVNTDVSDAVNTITALGYQRAVVMKAMEKVDKSLPTPELITVVLRELAKR